MPEIQRVSHTHNAIMDYMLACPGISLGEIAKHFGYTQPWLSCIIHSDAFQTLMKEKQGVMFHHTVLPLREKMLHVANIGLDRMIERLPIETDMSVLSKTTEGVLDRLGFGTKQGNTLIINQTNNTQVNTLKSELDEARALMGQLPRPQIGVTIDDSGKLPALPAPSEAAMGALDSGEGLTVSTSGSDGPSATEGDQT